jgi:hypothetical protein
MQQQNNMSNAVDDDDSKSNARIIADCLVQTGNSASGGCMEPQKRAT